MEEDERDYRESEDEDFDPEGVAKEENVSSSSEDEEAGKPKGRTTKRPAQKRAAPEDVDLDSGDEATIKQSRRKRRKQGEEDEAESAGESGLIKTRAQRRAEHEERKEQRRTYHGEVTIDVDDLWSKMTAVPVGRRKDAAIPVAPIADPAATVETTGNGSADLESKTQADSAPVALHEDDFVTIKKSYEFAGQIVSEEKRVPRDSAEAKLYVSKSGEPEAITPLSRIDGNGALLRRPLKRASMFEPNPTGEVKGLPAHKQRLRTPSRADVLAQKMRLDEEAKARGDKAVRINTVQKSKLDWASHVDTEGLRDELAEYDRSKQGYMSRMEFLQDVQGRRDQEERTARLQKV